MNRTSLRHRAVSYVIQGTQKRDFRMERRRVTGQVESRGFSDVR